MQIIYPLKTLRTLVLHAQGLTTASGAELNPTLTRINRIAERLNYVQIDTLNLIQRSHYIVLWGRLGSYTPGDFDRLIYAAEHRKLFEGIQNVAAIIPLKDYRYQLGPKDHGRETLLRWYNSMLEREGGHDLVPLVLERIRQEGALRASDFEYKGPRRGSWWDWKPAKTALEYLFVKGELMVTNRVNFQRVYDLTERVLPAWVNTAPPSIEERDWYWVEQGLIAMGTCLPNQIAEYSFHMRHIYPKAIGTEMLKQGLLVPVEGILADGEAHELVLHRSQQKNLEKIAEGEIKAERTTFLTFFDSLFWCRGRDLYLWNYRNLLEAYVPQAKRQYGYFCLSILHKDRLVGRFDPKQERKTGLLRIKALYLEEGVKPEEGLVGGMATAMRDFMSFHGAKDLVIEKSTPVEFGQKLLKAM